MRGHLPEEHEVEAAAVEQYTVRNHDAVTAVSAAITAGAVAAARRGRLQVQPLPPCCSKGRDSR